MPTLPEIIRKATIPRSHASAESARWKLTRDRLVANYNVLIVELWVLAQPIGKSE
jgi:hypothetical protein